MSMNPLGWVRAAFKNAAINGIHDALQEVASDDALPRQMSDAIQPRLLGIGNQSAAVLDRPTEKEPIEGSRKQAKK